MKEIGKTKEYDLFATISGNRNINNANLKRIVESIQQQNLLEHNPIIINKHYEVIDGQHRLEAARILEIPIYYTMIKKANIEEVHLLNASQKPWALKDYIQGYCGMGKKPYQYLQDFMEEFKLPVRQSIILIKPGESESRMGRGFKQGKLNITEYEYFCAKKDVKEMITTFSPYVDFFNSAFCAAFKKILKLEGYDEKVMVTHLRLLNPDNIKYSATQKTLQQLENIYNYGLSKKNRLRFY